MKGLGRTSFIPESVSDLLICRFEMKLTITEIHVDIIGANVRGHGNDGEVGSNFSDADRC